MIRLFKRITEPITPDGEPTIRDSSVTIEQIHQELLMRTPQDQILAKYPDLEDEDVQAVWVYKAFQNRRDNVIDRQELINTFSVLPKKVSLLHLFDHINFVFQIQQGVADVADEKCIPHEQVMREMRQYITGLKIEEAK